MVSEGPNSTRLPLTSSCDTPFALHLLSEEYRCLVLAGLCRRYLRWWWSSLPGRHALSYKEGFVSSQYRMKYFGILINQQGREGAQGAGYVHRVTTVYNIANLSCHACVACMHLHLDLARHMYQSISMSINLVSLLYYTKLAVKPTVRTTYFPPPPYSSNCNTIGNSWILFWWDLSTKHNNIVVCNLGTISLTHK